MRALARELTAQGRHAALHFSCEAGEPVGDDYREAQLALLGDLRRRAGIEPPEELRPPAPWPEASDSQILSAALSSWATSCPLPLVLFFDEVDALRGEGLKAVLRQLRAGYPDRPEGFPASVVLCGLRDVRDSKAESGGDPGRLGTSSGFLEREYGVGRGRIDLLLRWPYSAPAGDEAGGRLWQREALELKVWRPKKPDPLEAGLEQLDAYLGRLDLEGGALVLFDRRPDALPIEERTSLTETETPTGRPVLLLRG